MPFRLFLLALLLPLYSFGQQTFTFEHGGMEREYNLYLPAGLTSDAPLVFVLHGYTSSADIIMSYCGMNETADANGFAVVYPQGSQDFFGINHWNANLTISNTDDVGFLSELAAFLQAEYDLDPERTFTCGMSNGGFMSYTLACERPDVFKAIASVTGTMSGATWNNCDPENPVPVFQIHGLEDDTVPYDGSMDTWGGWGGAPGTEGVVDFWVDLNQCSTMSEEVLSGILTGIYHAEGINGNEVWFYPLEEWGHSWPGPWAVGETGINASDEIWEFFSRVGTISTATNEALQSAQLVVYPNPVQAALQLEWSDNKSRTYRIYDLLGQAWVTGFVETDHLSLDVAHLPAGAYFLWVDGEVHKIQKID
jgi:polyhydroxybutyrate depolymerase